MCDGAILGGFADPLAELPFHLPFRTRKDSELADARAAISIAAPIRVADTENEGLSRQNVLCRGLHGGRHGSWIRRRSGRGE